MARENVRRAKFRVIINTRSPKTQLLLEVSGILSQPKLTRHTSVKNEDEKRKKKEQQHQMPAKCNEVQANGIYFVLHKKRKSAYSCNYKLHDTAE